MGGFVKKVLLSINYFNINKTYSAIVAFNFLSSL